MNFCGKSFPMQQTLTGFLTLSEFKQKTPNLEGVRSAAGALDLKLSRDQWFRIWTGSAGHEVP